MKFTLEGFLIRFKACFKVIVFTLLLIGFMLVPAWLNWNWPITLVLGIISLSLTVLAGTDFVKKHTQVTFKKDGEKTDLWMIISIGVSIGGVVAVWVDNNASKLDKDAYRIALIILVIIAGCSVYLTEKKKKNKKAP
ncbi:cation transport ATPase [Pantoea agglomerans]|uniref:hypothetical protein n=1 Tax=Enterobacter agglomerans TaxID=549 RepID=UPI00278ACC15|nr:hypothetical protein [Pantoea agglomerans]MDQ0629387.1 cation transport ATPase [Pantoea agglomerans]